MLRKLALSRTRPRVRRPRARTVTVALGMAYLAAIGLTAVSWANGETAFDAVLGPFMLGFAVVATVSAVVAARQPRLDARSRRGWVVMAVAFAILAVSCMLFRVTELLPFPTVGDAVRLLFPLILLTGLLVLPARERSARDSYKIVLDIGIVVAGSAMLLWVLVLSSVLDRGSALPLVTAAGAAYPIGDLALIFGAVNVLYRTTSPATRRPLQLLVAAVVFFVVGDVALGYQRANSLSGSYLVWQFLCWMTAHFLVALAAVEQCHQAGVQHPQRALERRLRPIPRLPYVAVAAGYLVLLVMTSRLDLYPFGGLIIGAMAMTFLVMARQIVALRENHELAVTDNLTGLANRALLRHSLNRALDRTRRSGIPVAVLLIDLNGFKAINDTLGHEAGDEMLVAFARLLENTVRRSDTVARLGGDEFAVILQSDDAAADADLVAERIREAMLTTVIVGGQPLRPRASIGIATSDTADCTASELLHRADTEMYRVKRAERDSVPAHRGGLAAPRANLATSH